MYLSLVVLISNLICLTLCLLSQITLGAMDADMCTKLNLGIYLEEYLRRYPNAKYLFTEADDDEALKRLKQNHRNNMD